MIDVTKIKDELLKFHNQDIDYLHDNTPVEIQKKVAKLWKNIIDVGFSGITPPSSTVIIAANLMESLMNAPFAGQLIASHFSQCMTIIGNGMNVPASLYSVSPPPAPLVLSAPFLDKELSSQTLANQIVAYAKTGKSTLLLPPNTIKPWL